MKTPAMRRMFLSAGLIAGMQLGLGLGDGRAQVPAPASPRPGQILVSGSVPDEASKAAVLARLRELYGADQVLDQIAVGGVAMPANWAGYVQKLIGPNLKLISRGQLKIDGNSVSLRGEVANEAQRQQIASEVANSLNPTYTVNNGLRVGASEQNLLDAALAKRIIEFDSGKASLKPSGQGILDEMALALRKVGGKKVEVIGHTDNVGLRESNLALSLARAEAVRAYLAGKGIDPGQVLVSGQGPDRPVADNQSADGRARNRRIEFRIAQ
jgi:OmpA-OmpF porin, OOP family